jgi:hypothetical protein
VPLIFILGGVSDDPISPDCYGFYFVALFVFTIPVRVLFTWLWNSTRGSLIIVALAHGAFNVTTGQKFLPEFAPGDTLWVYGVYTVTGPDRHRHHSRPARLQGERCRAVGVSRAGGYYRTSGCHHHPSRVPLDDSGEHEA